MHEPWNRGKHSAFVRAGSGVFLGAATWALLSPASVAGTLGPSPHVLWPASWVLFVPIVLVEALVGARVFVVPYTRALWIAGAANLVSMLLGIPLSWLILAASPDALAGLARHGPWFGPGRDHPAWFAIAAALLLCVPLFVSSVWIEFLVARRLAPATSRPLALGWSWLANLASYGAICIATAVAAFILACVD